MKYFLMLAVLCMSFLAVGCDDSDGDGKTTRAAWDTVDNTCVFTPRGHFFKVISHRDIGQINRHLSREVEHTHVDKGHIIVCSEGRWVLAEYTPARNHSPFSHSIGDNVWVDLTKPVVLNYVTTHKPHLVEQYWVADPWPQDENGNDIIPEEHNSLNNMQPGHTVRILPDCVEVE